MLSVISNNTEVCILLQYTNNPEKVIQNFTVTVSSPISTNGAIGFLISNFIIHHQLVTKLYTF